MPLIKLVDWKVSPDIKISDNILNDIIKNYTDNILITAGPGTGKTEMLAQKACFLLQTGLCKFPKKILTLCFKVDAAKNLKERINKRCGEDAKNQFVSLTFDAFFISIVRRFSCFLPEWISPLNPNFEVGAFEQIKNLPFDLSNNIAENIKNDINRNIITNKLHWDTCKSLAYTIIKNSNEVRNLIASTYEYVFLDEFQDTTINQYKFIKQLFNDYNSKIIAVGDSNQMIMRWAGANKQVFELFKKDFSAKHNYLSINHRSNKNIVDFINYIGKNITSDNETFIEYESIRENLLEHSIFAGEYSNKLDEANNIAIYINKILQNNNTLHPNDFALIIRQKATQYANEVKSVFENLGLELRNEDEEIYKGGFRIQDVVEEPLSDLFINIFRKKEKIIPPNDNKELIFMYSQLRNINLSNEKQYKKMIEEINNIIKNIDYNMGIDKCTDYIISFLGNNIKRYKILSNEADYKKIKKSFDIFFQRCMDNSSTLNCAINQYLGKNQVKLMTIHKSKGLEFDTVFFIDFNATSWWGLNKAYQEDNFDKILEEKNTFFVGASRAKEKLIFTNSEKNNWPNVITDILNNSNMIQSFE
ncbi:MAG: ATP-dependent helicase [Alphaproteobacteria bacterium]|nr:ATP-dependent helicase [Alphaproteobacteria bacterium]